ncbi:hypothetical protein NX059_009564 [Plenodomus lindquistii]|nr:hypothetical protein NX059_009564 [Plenodomus lindquistii]
MGKEVWRNAKPECHCPKAAEKILSEVSLGKRKVRTDEEDAFALVWIVWRKAMTP